LSLPNKSVIVHILKKIHVILLRRLFLNTLTKKKRLQLINLSQQILINCNTLISLTNHH